MGGGLSIDSSSDANSERDAEIDTVSEGAAEDEIEKEISAENETERATTAENETTVSHINSLNRAFEVDRAINRASEKFVIIRFGVADDDDCKEIDKWIKCDAADVNNFADIYTVEMNDVSELVSRDGLSGKCSIIFFHNGIVVRRLSTAEIKKQMTEKFREIANNIKHTEHP